MTERYRGCNGDVPPRHSDAFFRVSFENHGFTAINGARDDSLRSRSIPSDHADRADGREDALESRRPPIVADYLGIGASEDDQDSHLDKFAMTNITPPSSPSENKVPKRKKPGDRTAKEVKEAKRLKQTSMQIKNSNTAVGRYKVASNPASSSAHGLRINEADIAPTYPLQTQTLSATHQDTSALIRSTEDVFLSHKTSPRLGTWKDRPKVAQEPDFRIPPENCGGRISLITPITSMDLVRSSQIPSRQTRNISDQESHRIQSTGQGLDQAKSHTIPTRSGRGPSTCPAPIPNAEKPALIMPDSRELPFTEQNSKYLKPVVSDQFNATIPKSGQESSSLVFASDISFLSMKTSASEAEMLNLHYIDDELSGVDDIDENDLLELESLTTDHCSTIRQKPEDNQSFLPAQRQVGSHEPQNLEDSLLEPVEDDEWMQIPDHDLDIVDLTSLTPTLATKAHTISDINMEQQPLVIEQSNASQATKNSTVAPSSLTSSSLNIAFPPIVRPIFPAPILDRSPLLNITSSLTLKTCFRIGEVLNIGTQYAQQASTCVSDSILLELYARVISSWRPTSHSSTRQDFVFADLWSDKAPRLNGEWNSWKGSKVFDDDAKNLLTDNEVEEGKTKMCRAVGRMKREKKEWRFKVLSVWKCDWDDINAVKAIICPDRS